MSDISVDTFSSLIYNDRKERILQMDYLVSVVIPTYKRELKYLQRSVESVLNQTYSNIELIIVDDNSENPYFRELVETYVSSLDSSVVRLLKNEKNLGGSLTRNVGIDASTGDFITFLDDDDAYLPNRIEELIDYMLAEDCDMVFTNMIMRNNKGVVVDYREHSKIESFDNDYLFRYHLTRIISGTSSFIYRSEAIRKIGCFQDAKMGQDFFLMVRSIQGGLKIRYLNTNTVVVYKHSDGGISQGKNKIIGENNLYNFKKQFFHLMTSEEKRYIKFRHYAVMVVAYMRNRNPFGMLAMGFMALISSPIDFFTDVFGFFKRIRTHKNDEIIIPTQPHTVPETVTK